MLSCPELFLEQLDWMDNGAHVLFGYCSCYCQYLPLETTLHFFYFKKLLLTCKENWF